MTIHHKHLNFTENTVPPPSTESCQHEEMLKVIKLFMSNYKC